MSDTLYFATSRSMRPGEVAITREYAALLLKDGRPKQVGNRRTIRLWSILDGVFFVRAARRCRHLAGTAPVRCCQETDHEGPHMYKCASPRCPGFGWLASNTPHPVPPCF